MRKIRSVWVAQLEASLEREERPAVRRYLTACINAIRCRDRTSFQGVRIYEGRKEMSKDASSSS